MRIILGKWLSGGAALSLAAATLTACGQSQPAADGEPVTVLAAFYPLQYAAQEVGGDRVAVESLTPPGAEPHDVELSPAQIAEVGEADLVLYIKGFQPAVDEAVAQVAGDRAVDVSQGVELLEAGGHSEDDSGHSDATGHSEEASGHADATGHSAEEGSHARDDGHGHGAVDPHIWLDPLNMITVGDTIRDRLSAADEAGAGQYRTNAAGFADRLTDLDRTWAEGTAKCRSRDLVVSHEAFAYLADRYDFEQVGVSGLSPEAEPSPAQVAEAVDFVRANDVRTVYFETLVDPKVAATVAAEAGVDTGVLDPLEGLPEGSDATYFTVMADNLAAVAAGQPCT